MDTVEKENLASMSKEEAALYDRQIRLWGMEAQNRLRNSSVLVVGVSQLGCEFIKNITLAGIKNLTIMDSRNLTKEDMEQTFLFLNKDDIGKNRAEAALPRTNILNPNVQLNSISGDIVKYLDEHGADWLSKFSLVCLVDQEYECVCRVNQLCRERNVRFMSSGIFGFLGFTFFDFNSHNFLKKVVSPSTTAFLDENQLLVDENGKPFTVLDEDRFEKTAFEYPSFEDSLSATYRNVKLTKRSKRLMSPVYFLLKALLRLQKNNMLSEDNEEFKKELEKVWMEELEDSQQNLNEQPIQPTDFKYLMNPPFAATSACTGGIMGQEAIKALSEGKDPLRNLFIYTSIESAGYICDLPFKV